MNCPLLPMDRDDLHQGAKTLVTKCKAAHCGFVTSPLDTDFMPGGCVLLVVALLDKERPEKEIEL